MKHTKGEAISGWLVVDKPEGMTSTQVTGLVRRLFNAQKSGHVGTLDPFASGVLPVALGEATKLIDFLTDESKEYEFTLQWGAETDSGDSDGTVILRNENLPTKTEISSVLSQFKGKIRQVPPAFSAIKINGQRAYDLARKGQKVAMPEREVEIFALEYIDNVAADKSRFRVCCSKGTYVRALGRDIARSLGCAGYLCALRRTRSGLFDLSRKILLEHLKNIVYVEERKKFLLPLETSLRDIAVMAVSEADAAKLRQGQALSPQVAAGQNLSSATVAACCDGKLTAMVRVEERKISPIRVFNL